MKRKAFKMYLKEGCEEEYVKRYNALWPDLKDLFKEKGIVDFSIYWDKESNCLYAYQIRSKSMDENSLNDSMIMRRWWEYISDIIETDSKNQPIVLPLEEMFHIDWF